jgi:hypothetical protein
MKGKKWPDHEKLLWLMAEIHDWDKAPEDLMNRALKLWFTAQDFVEITQEIDGIFASGIEINCPADLARVLEEAVKR